MGFNPEASALDIHRRGEAHTSGRGSGMVANAGEQINVTGKGLAETLLTTLEKLGLDLLFMKAQGYDGARAMCGEFKGCAAIVNKSYPEALYLYCANHGLNKAITHACQIPSIRNCMAAVKATVNFFRNSNKAGAMLKGFILAANPGARQIRLLKFCETRWVEHLDSLSLFYEVLEYVRLALEELDEKTTQCDGVQPYALLSSIRTAPFIIALTVLKPIFSLTKNLSVFLQKEDCDLSKCVAFANDLYEELKDMRSSADEQFHKMSSSVS
ncbi:uncharacterized protein LOC118740037 [Rhagoletis pomonella]|uniref:uncharacterized protein LOC118740037 n=1 Tax=Rhagoletis pomonella TaxID=28610 RepID=UPI0017808B6F|nr:uncharacterized protein LOC118740037 [Rhagoletis pomonella]